MRISTKNILLVLFVLFAVVISVEKTNAFALSGENKENDANHSKAVAITVNGVKIMESQIEEIVNKRVSERTGYTPDYNLSEHRRNARKAVISELVFTELVFQKGKQKHVTVSDKKVTEMINKMAAREHLPFDKYTFDEYKRKAEEYYDDFPEYRQSLKVQLLFNKLLKKEYANKLKPTEKQMKAYYDENIRYLSEPEQIRVCCIYIRPDKDSNDPNQAKIEAKVKAQELRGRIRNSADFDIELAKSETEGREFGWQRKVELRPWPNEFEKAKYDLNKPGQISDVVETRHVFSPGQISDVVETRHVFSIIKCIGLKDAHTPSLREVKEKVRQHVRNKLMEQAYYEYSQKIMTEADIKFTNEQDKFEIPSSPIQE